jgi:hypothetical protein
MTNVNTPRATLSLHDDLLIFLVNVIVGVPVLAESVDVLLAVVPFCTTEKERVVGENDNILGTVTVSVTARVALV